MDHRRVVVATDFSAASGAAAAFALRLAPQAEMHVLHVRAAAPPRIVGPPAVQDVERERDALRERLADWAREHGLAQAHVENGSARREIPRQAEMLGADLVVLGATGQTGLRDRLIGSTARHVARAATMDVLVTRGAAPEGWPRHVLVATDFETPSIHALRRAHGLAQRPGAATALTIAHVVDADVWRGAASSRSPGGSATDMEAERNAAARALAQVNDAELGGRARPVVRTGRPVGALADVAAEVGADLCVTGTHGAGAVERALLGRVAEGIVEQAPCSVLVAREAVGRPR